MTERPTAPHAVRLAGLRKAYGDTVAVFGRTPREAVDAGMVGAMLQDGAMLEDATVGELVALFASVHRHRLAVDEVLERAGIAGLAGRRATELSGGQTQRVRFALALVPDPDLVVLDEPTVAMDVATRREFWAAMRGFVAGGRTVLFATHYLDEADGFADRIMLLHDGRVVADGTPRHVKSIVAVRTVRATVPDLSAGVLHELFGADGVSVDGADVRIRTVDGDGVLRTLLAHSPEAHDIEVTGADLEEAFLSLTARTGGAVA